jgi:hypothetical protein
MAVSGGPGAAARAGRGGADGADDRPDGGGPQRRRGVGGGGGSGREERHGAGVEVREGPADPGGGRGGLEAIQEPAGAGAEARGPRRVAARAGGRGAAVDGAGARRRLSPACDARPTTTAEAGGERTALASAGNFTLFTQPPHEGQPTLSANAASASFSIRRCMSPAPVRACARRLLNDAQLVRARARTCAFACACACARPCVRRTGSCVSLCVAVSVRAPSRVCTCVRARVYVRVRARVFACVRVCLRACVCVHLGALVSMCTCTCVLGRARTCATYGPRHERPALYLHDLHCLFYTVIRSFTP